jgi:hypothetical protein
MKYFEKFAAFNPKRLIGPTLGAATFGLSGYNKPGPPYIRKY